MIHEQFRVARCSIMDKINNGGDFLIELKLFKNRVFIFSDSTDECEAFFLRIRPDKVEKFLNGEFDSEVHHLLILIHLIE